MSQAWDGGAGPFVSEGGAAIAAHTEESPNSIFDTWVSDYAQTGEAVTVDFRELAPFGAGADRATHLVHPYPAKLLLNIPYFLLRCAKLAPDGARVLDPFCGSGTVILESRLRGFIADGADANPLARLITRAKTIGLPPDRLLEQLSQIVLLAASCLPDYPDVVNRDYWFSPAVSLALGRLRAAILQATEGHDQDFFFMCLSSCVRRVSFADPRLSVPVKINPDRAAKYGAKGEDVIKRLTRLSDVDVSKVFWSISLQNIARTRRLVELQATAIEAPTIDDDARSLTAPDETYDLVMTSPPYVGAQKYVRASSLSLGWLGLTPQTALRPLERKSIGREHLDFNERARPYASGMPDADAVLEQIGQRNLVRASIAGAYLSEMKAAIGELARVTKTGGHLVLIVGANQVAGLHFDTPRYLQTLAEAQGFRLVTHLLDDIRSRGLMVKRNATASMITRESVLVMRRERDPNG